MSQIAALPPLSVSVEEAARMIGCSRTGIYELMAKGELPTFKMGKRRLVQVQELKAWIDRAVQAGSR
jgi:excisionase family DNA binding protein